ncbi:MAG TPA: glycosyltransferase family 39 protein [Terriglobales bacterium]
MMAEVTSQSQSLVNHVRKAALLVLTTGFALRLYLASGTFLNPDETLHFFIANQSSLSQAYRESLTMAHPPLLIFFLYFWRNVGTSEFVLRLPFVVAGTGFCWLFFKWLNRLFGGMTALIGLTFAALIAPMALLSVEVRQYELLLFFAISGAYLLEDALQKRSAILMVFSAACLYLALLSHYSAPLFVASLGAYALVRLIVDRQPIAVSMAWAAGQIGAIALIGYLYFTHVSKIRTTTMANQAIDSWLYKSYFHPGHGNVVVFILARTFSLFQFMLGQAIIGDLAALAFVAGVVFLLRGKLSPPPSAPDPRLLALLLVLPFVMNCAAGLLAIYPYGGTRHCVYLAIFGLAGIALFIASLTNGRTIKAMAITLALVAVCWAFRSIRHPYIYRVDQSRANIQQALNFIREKVPASDLIFVDYESGLELGHYLCEQKPITYDGSIPGFLVFNCDDHRIVSTINDLWAFDPQMFAEQWKRLIAAAGLRPDDQVWVVQAGWIVTLADDLQKDAPDFRQIPVQRFGKNIQMFPLKADSPIPSAIQPKPESRRNYFNASSLAWAKRPTSPPGFSF